MRARSAVFSSLLAPFRRGARRLSRDARGVTAVEFGLIATPFIGVTFAIIETSIVLFTGQALDTALQDTARTLMTGSAQSSGVTQVQFKTNVCNRMPALVDCNGKVFIDVRSYPDNAPAPTMPTATWATDVANFIYKPGGPNCIVVARAVVKLNVYATIWGNGLANMPDGTRGIMSSVSFRNEPFNTPAPCEAT